MVALHLNDNHFFEDKNETNNDRQGCTNTWRVEAARCSILRARPHRHAIWQIVVD